ncbi:MAG TPA: hypothetical protein VFC10_09340 [Terriglobia bacterium]|nr:hypothetical protein [Terriglobia bacterium]
MAFLTLDSLLEISLRIFLKHEKKITIDPKTHRPRHILVDIAKKNIKVDDSVWKHLGYCYEEIRCPLYHEASDMTVTDAMLDDFSETVYFLLDQMFGLAAKDLAEEGRRIPLGGKGAPPVVAVNPNKLARRVDVVILAIGLKPAKDSREVVAHLGQLGYSKDFPAKDVASYLAQGKYFYKDPSDELWKLTAAVGRPRFEELTRTQEQK